MFHFYLNLAYLIPNIYLLFRINSLFISKSYRLIYFVVYLLLASVYPVAEMFSHDDAGGFLRILETVSGYILPLYLYLFMLVLFYELILVVNHWLKVVPHSTRKGFSYRFYVFSSILLLSVSIVVAGSVNLNTIRVSRYHIETARNNSGIRHLRLAFVADFHIRHDTDVGFVKQFEERIRELQPDLMLYGGDIIEGRLEHRIDGKITSVLNEIKPVYGSFGVFGNHDLNGGHEPRSFFEHAGITVLKDSVVRIDSSFYIAGRYDERVRDRKDISVLLQDADDLPLVLLDHRPSDILNVSHTTADLQFSGHTHNGQMFPLNFIVQNMNELSWGYKKIKNTHFFVTSGLRLWGPPVKTAGKSEIMLVDIYFQ